MDQSYYYTNNYMTSAPDHAAAATLSATAILLIVFIYIVVLAGAYVISALLLGQIFKKAGVPRWAAWVPFYNSWKLLEIGGQQGFWAVLALVPLVNIASAVFLYIAMYYIGLKLKKSGAFLLLGIFIPIVWYAILALDSSKWDESRAPQAPKIG